MLWCLLNESSDLTRVTRGTLNIAQHSSRPSRAMQGRLRFGLGITLIILLVSG